MDTLAELGYAMHPPLIMQQYGYAPDDWQRKILVQRPSRLLLNCSRQAGKTTVVAAMAVDEMLRGPALVLAICPSERQSKELVRTASQIYAAIGSLPTQQSTTCLQCDNGARMFALPSTEANIRGFSKVALLLIDEASRVQDDLYRSVRPMLAVSGGRLACLSTPFGKRGFFHEEWIGGSGWDRVRITAEQCPRITAEFLAQEKRTLPAMWYRQEYFCEFAESEGSVFNFDDIQAGADPTLRPLFPAHVLQSERTM